MKNNEIIQKLLELGWEPAPYTQPEEDNFHLEKEFEISKTNECSNYIDYTPEPNELIYISYEIYPNLEQARFFIWDKLDGAYYGLADYEEVLELALEDRLFTYPQKLKEVDR